MVVLPNAGEIHNDDSHGSLEFVKKNQLKTQALRFSVVYLGCCPLPVTVTTRIVAFLVGDSYKPSFATVTGRGPYPRCINVSFWVDLSKIEVSQVKMKDTPLKMNVESKIT